MVVTSAKVTPSAFVISPSSFDFRPLLLLLHHMSIARTLTSSSTRLLTRQPSRISTHSFTFQNFKLGSSFSTTSPAMSASVKKTVDEAIAQHKVVVFSKSYCPVSDRPCVALDSIIVRDHPDVIVILVSSGHLTASRSPLNNRVNIC